VRPPSPLASPLATYFSWSDDGVLWRYRLHIIVLDPSSVTSGGWFEDTSLVEKYTISDEAYDKLGSKFILCKCLTRDLLSMKYYVRVVYYILCKRLDTCCSSNLCSKQFVILQEILN
jgi:hypothetical protein